MGSLGPIRVYLQFQRQKKVNYLIKDESKYNIGTYLNICLVYCILNKE
jgi:hypothetical protein